MATSRDRAKAGAGGGHMFWVEQLRFTTSVSLTTQVPGFPLDRHAKILSARKQHECTEKKSCSPVQEAVENCRRHLVDLTHHAHMVGNLSVCIQQDADGQLVPDRFEGNRARREGQGSNALSP